MGQVLSQERNSTYKPKTRPPHSISKSTNSLHKTAKKTISVLWNSIEGIQQTERYLFTKTNELWVRTGVYKHSYLWLFPSLPTCQCMTLTRVGHSVKTTVSPPLLKRNLLMWCIVSLSGDLWFSLRLQDSLWQATNWQTSWGCHRSSGRWDSRRGLINYSVAQIKQRL